MVTTAGAAVTMCAAVSESPLKLPSSGVYVAVRVLAPWTFEVSTHEPDAPAAEVQVPPLPSVTVTEPVGVPAPGAFTERFQLTV